MIILICILITFLFIYWTRAFNNSEFASQLGSEDIMFFIVILSAFIIITDHLIVNKSFELKLRFYIFLIFIMNLAVSRIIRHMYEINDLDTLFIATAAFPYLVYGMRFLRKFIQWSTSASDKNIKEIEEGFFINRIYYGVILLFTGIYGYITHVLLNLIDW
jgi:hypothetical protein